jgi:YidC/Oxa1 family membrane protein insertase
MNDRRTATAVLLCIMFVIFYTQAFIAPKTRNTFNSKDSVVSNSQQSTDQQVQQSPQDSFTPPTTNAPLNSDNVKFPTSNELKSSPTAIIELPALKLKLNLLGGRFQDVTLLNFKEEVAKSSSYLKLLDENKNSNYLTGAVFLGAEGDHLVKYQIVKLENCNLKDGVVEPINPDKFSIDLEGEWLGGKIVKKLTFDPSISYLINLNIELVDIKNSAPIVYEWSEHFSPEKLENRLDPEQITTLSAESKLEHLAISSLVASVNKESVKWIAFNDKYFIHSVIPESPTKISYGKFNDRFSIRLVASDSTKANFNLYLGPKKREILERAGFDLKKAIDLGYFAVVAEPLVALLKMLYALFGNWGLSIIALTLLVKLALYPFARLSFKSMQAMQAIQPELKRIQELYKDDEVRLRTEMMSLYRNKGVNPMGGCLPMLLQIPVFFGLYNGLLNAIELRHAPFALWIKDLSAPERLLIFGIPVPVMIILMGISMIAQTWLQPSTGDPQQRRIMLFMPVVFTIMFIIFPMPSGLVLYWLVNNIISIVQQSYIKSNTKANPLLSTAVVSLAIFGVGFVLTII